MVFERSRWIVLVLSMLWVTGICAAAELESLYSDFLSAARKGALSQQQVSTFSDRLLKRMDPSGVEACSRALDPNLDWSQTTLTYSPLAACSAKNLTGDRSMMALLHAITQETVIDEEASNQRPRSPQAASSSGEDILVGDPQGWFYVGPFSIGKTELDSDPFVPKELCDIRNSNLEGEAGCGIKGLPLTLEGKKLFQRKMLEKVLAAAKKATEGAAPPESKKEKKPKKSTEARKQESWLSWIVQPTRFLSEIRPKGKLDWSSLPSPGTGSKASTTARNGRSVKGQSSSSPISVSLNVDHSSEVQGMIQELGTMGVMEFVGYAVGEYAVLSHHVLITVQARSLHSLFYSFEPVGGTPNNGSAHSIRLYPLAADLYGRHGEFSFTWTDPGLLRFYVRLRGVAQVRAELRIYAAPISFTQRKQKAGTGGILSSLLGSGSNANEVSVPTPLWSLFEPLYIPDIVRGRFFGPVTGKGFNVVDIAVPVTVRSGGPATFVGASISLGSSGVGVCIGAACGSVQRQKGAAFTDPLEERYLTSFLYEPPSQLSCIVHPGQVFPCHLRIGIMDSDRMEKSCSSMTKPSGDDPKISTVLKMKFRFEDSELEEEKELRFQFRCRDFATKTFSTTFRALDGGVATAAIRPPFFSPSSEVTSKPTAVPVVLSLHGTGVTAANQADSYKRSAVKAEVDAGLSSGGYVFGVEGAWLVAADRHGAHNWETVGQLTAMAALFWVGLTSQDSKSWNGSPRADTTAVIFAGHSMGGHGALHLATLYPNRAIGAAFIASWLNKEHYGEANAIWRLDRSTSTTVANLKATLEATVSDSTPDYLLSNLVSIPIFIRVGAKDRTVSSYFSRRLYRSLLEDGHNDVVYDEVKDQEHWWWDTKSPNDGGCVNDETVRKFFSRILRAHQKKNQSPKIRSLFATLPVKGGSCVNGVCMIEQENIHQLSRLSVDVTDLANQDWEATSLKIATLNLRTIAINTAALTELWPSDCHMGEDNCLPPQRLTIKIDDSEIASPKDRANPLRLCLQQWGKEEGVAAEGEGHRHWAICPSASGDSVRGGVPIPSPPSGAFKSYSESGPIMVVLPRQCSGRNSEGTGLQQVADKCNQLRRFALWFANLNWIAYETPVTIAEVGSPEYLRVLQERNEKANAIDLDRSLGYISFPGMDFNWTSSSDAPQLPFPDQLQRTGFVKVLPRSNTSSGVVAVDGLLYQGAHLGIGVTSGRDTWLTATSAIGLEHLLFNVGQPTVPPMMRVPFGNLLPPIFVADASKAHRGSGAMLLGGFWNRTKLDSHLCYDWEGRC